MCQFFRVHIKRIKCSELYYYFYFYYSYRKAESKDAYSGSSSLFLLRTSFSEALSCPQAGFASCTEIITPELTPLFTIEE